MIIDREYVVIHEVMRTQVIQLDELQMDVWVYIASYSVHKTSTVRVNIVGGLEREYE